MVEKEKTFHGWRKQIEKHSDITILIFAASLSNAIIDVYIDVDNILTKISILIVLTPIFFTVLWFLYSRYLMRGKIEYIEKGIKKLLEKEQFAYSPEEEIFNFNKKTFGYFYKKEEIFEHVEKNGSSKGRIRVCLAVIDKVNVLKYKKHYMQIDELPTNDFENGEGLKMKLWNIEKVDDTSKVAPTNCENTECVCNKNGNICAYAEKSGFSGKIKIEEIDKDPRGNKILLRYNFVSGLRKITGLKGVCRYNVIGDWPIGSFALTKEDLDKKNKFLKESDKNKREHYFVQIKEPIEYLRICLEFPSFMNNATFFKKVVLPDDHNYIVHSEAKRMKEIPVTTDEQTVRIVNYEIKYPIVGLQYMIEWEPLIVKDNKNMPGISI